MLVLAIESSGMTASVALAAKDQLFAEYTINNKKTHSQTLLPMIDEIFRTTEIAKESIDAIAISKGPGSFTGLRIGSATAKGIGLALKKPVVEVPTLKAMAWNLWGSACLICPMIDARRDTVFTGIFRFENGELNTVLEDCALSVKKLAVLLNEKQEKVVFLGDGADRYLELLSEELTVPFSVAPASHNRPRAAAVAALGLEGLEQGEAMDAKAHVPEYLRVSSAEREREEKLAAQKGADE